MFDLQTAVRTEVLQPTPSVLAASPEGVTVAAGILHAGSVSEAIEQIGTHLFEQYGVDQATVMMTQLQPDIKKDWEPVGDRAWIRVWRRPGSRCLANLPDRDGAEQALSLPWSSPIARQQVVALPDIANLPDDAAQDRWELLECGGRALATRTVTRNGELYGSVAIAREEPGWWPDQAIADIELLSATLASRMAEERAAAVLAETIDRADRAVESQQHFFAAMGHELRTPIAAILGSADILGSDAGDAEAAPETTDVTKFAAGVRHDARVIQSAGEHLLAIVEDLLSTGKELGSTTARQGVDVAEAVADVVHWLRTPSRANDVAVHSRVDSGILVCTTPTALRQMLTNLVGNAINYHHRGGSVEVAASRATDEFGEPRVRIRVRDDGPGLSPEQQREVFKPFVRFATEVKGTGLGLPLSRTLAERDGGLMGVESVPGVGSSFWIDLPASPDSPDQPGQPTD